MAPIQEEDANKYRRSSPSFPYTGLDNYILLPSDVLLDAHSTLSDSTYQTRPCFTMAPGRKSSNGKSGLTVTLTVSPSKLRDVCKDLPAKEDSPASAEAEAEASDTKEKAATPPAEANGSPQASSQPPTQANGENVSDSNPGTPAPSGTPGPMGPPGKKGIKRGAANGEPKSRGKPGPKKRARVYVLTLFPTTRPSSFDVIG